MSRPPISRENSSNNLALNQQATDLQPKKDDKATDQATKSPSPQLNQKTDAKQPQPYGDTGFSKDDWTKHGQGSDEQSAQKQDQPKEKSSQGDEQKSSGKQADTAPKGKAASSTSKVNVPSLKLGRSGTATLKSRPPVSPDSLSGLGSHRTMSPRTGDSTPANSSSSALTPNANTQGQASSSAQSSAPPTRSLPPVPKTASSQTPSVSTSNVPMSARSATSAPSNANGFPASQLTTRAKSILDSALVNGKIDPADLGYLLVEVQTGGFKKNLSSFDQGTPFLRGGLQVSNFAASNGRTYDSINLIQTFLEPMAVGAFSTPECNELRKTLERNYLPVSSAMESAAKGMRPKQMQESEKIKNLMDPVIRPLTTWVCGKNENLTSSQLPDVWKSLLLGIDDAVVQWAKNIQSTDMKEIKRLRSEALVAFISTRGLMIAWGEKLQIFGEAKRIDQAKFSSYVNSYFSHRADKFIIDIMLSRKDLVADTFDTKMRGYINVLGGRKDLVSKAPKENLSGRRQLMKSKTLQSTKAPQANSSNTVSDESATLSPRMREKVEVVKTREIEQKQSVFQRQKFVRDFSKLANLAKISPEFFKAFQTHVVNEMSNRAYEKFVKDPVQLCTRYLGKFYVGVLNKERQAAEKFIRTALADIKQQDIDAIALAAEKVKSYVKADPEIALSQRGKNLTEKNTEIQSLVQKNEISEDRRKQVLGDFFFYTDTYKLSNDFRKSFTNYILELSVAEYVKFEAAPIASGLAYVEKWYSSLVAISPRADRNRLADEKKQLIDSLKNIHVDSIKGLKDSMEASSKPTSDAGSVVASPRLNLEFPANPVAEDEQQATILPTTTASTQPPQDSRTLPSSAVELNLVRENEISAERRIDFLNKFLELANIHDISEDFNNAFNKSILELSSIDYEKFLGNPIAACRDYVNYFYDLPFNQTKQSQASVNEDKPAFLYFLSWSERKNLEAINALATANAAPTSIVGTAASTASTQPPKDSRTPPVASVGVNPVAKDVESEKTEPSSESEIVTESDSDADNASSEKTEES